jgi:hypothetical protein
MRSARLYRGAGPATAALVMLLSMSAQAVRGAAPAKRYRTWSKKIARGVVLTRMIDTTGPNRIKVLRVNVARRPRMDVELANNRIPGHETTRSMARRNRAIAAVNGDYSLRPGTKGAGRPIDTFAEDGHLVASPLIWGVNFAVSRDETAAFMGHPKLAIQVRVPSSNATWTVNGWNADPRSTEETIGFTRTGGSWFRPPPRACSVRLFPVGHLGWGKGGIGVTKQFKVDRVACSRRPMRRRRGLVLSARARAPAADRMGALVPGQRLELLWSLGWPRILDAVGGNPQLIRDGRLAVGTCNSSYFCGRNPRTGIGLKPNGRVLLVTVDGRQPKYSVGMTLVGFARLFKRLGATKALNLDGGGSTTMVVRNQVVNRPSGVVQRPVGSAVLVLGHVDKDEWDPLRSPSAGRAPSASRRAERGAPAPCSALRDPGSTGGMLDALARGDLGWRPRVLPRALQRAVGVFRSAGGC